MSEDHRKRLTSEQMMRFFLAINQLRLTGEREFPMQLALAFSYISSHNGCRQEDLVTALNISSSSVSRNVTWLGPKHRLGKEGLKLVRRQRDMDDPKRYRLFLTPKGEDMRDAIERALSTKF
tara:strand:+ start:1051 stop:1416 length:366 start_codon:yes stop_codon:yes gene_type:complete